MSIGRDPLEHKGGYPGGGRRPATAEQHSCEELIPQVRDRLFEELPEIADTLRRRGERIAEIAASVVLDAVEARIRDQAQAAPLGSMQWRAHMADIAHVSALRMELQ